MVPGVTVNVSTINIIGNIVSLTLNWGEPFNNFDPILSYTISCSGDVTCPPRTTTTDNTTRNFNIINLISMTTYTFSVVATNSIGSGQAGVLDYTTPPGNFMYICISYTLGRGDFLICAYSWYLKATGLGASAYISE